MEPSASRTVAARTRLKTLRRCRSGVRTKTPKIEIHRYPARDAKHFRRLFAVIHAYLDDLRSSRFVFRPGWTCSMCDFRDTHCMAGLNQPPSFNYEELSMPGLTVTEKEWIGISILADHDATMKETVSDDQASVRDGKLIVSGSILTGRAAVHFENLLDTGRNSWITVSSSKALHFSSDAVSASQQGQVSA